MRKLLIALIIVLALPALASAYPGTSNSAANLGFDHPNSSGWDNANSVTRPVAVDPNGNVGVNVLNQGALPSTTTSIAASATGTAGAAVSTSLPAAVGKTTCLTGFSFTAGAATTAGTSQCTVTPASGTIGGAAALTWQLVEGTTSAAAGANVVGSVSPPVCASATNVALNVACTAVTSGAVVSATVSGVQQ